MAGSPARPFETRLPVAFYGPRGERRGQRFRKPQVVSSNPILGSALSSPHPIRKDDSKDDSRSQEGGRVDVVEAALAKALGEASACWPVGRRRPARQGTRSA